MSKYSKKSQPEAEAEAEATVQSALNELQELETMIEQTLRDKNKWPNIPQGVKVAFNLARVAFPFIASASARSRFDKCVYNIVKMLDAVKEKEFNSNVITIHEDNLTYDELLKSALIYTGYTFKLHAVIDNYNRMRAELEVKQSKKKNKIPFHQLDEYNKLLVNLMVTVNHAEAIAEAEAEAIAEATV